MKNMLFIFVAFMLGCQLHAQPLDDIVERKILKERRTLDFPPVREADIFWEKRVWRVINIREKMNQTFAYPEAPFFGILADAALQGEVTIYSAEDEAFSYPMSKQEFDGVLFSIDTFQVVDPITHLPIQRIEKNELNYEDVKRFRVKEVWFFDSNRSALNVRILGIAPLIEVYDDFGNFRYEKPLFWVHYPSIRPLLARHEVFNPGKDHSAMSWEDLFEMRFFASTIYKASNIHDRRISEYTTGLDQLQEADKIKQELFNFEHDLWSY